MPLDTSILRLFVYGTLKRGQRNHAAYCRGLLSAQPAQILGRLYDLPAGYPMLAVPPEMVLALGTADLLADVRRQDEAFPAAQTGAEPWDVHTAPGAPWQLIAGELFEFADPLPALIACDALEEFQPGGGGTYDRVLVRLAEPFGLMAWTYVAPGGQLPAGARDCGTSWPADRS